MSFKLILISFCFLSLFQTEPSSKGALILKKMYTTYHGKWYKNLTFVQDTKMYNHDTLKKTEQWHEALQFPNKFRIDMGPSDSGNAVIFKNDSAYRFRKFKLTSVKFYENDLLFLLGGMYYYSFAEVLKKVEHFGFDLSKTFKTNWKGNVVYVIGGERELDETNQLWIDAKTLSIVRMIKHVDGHKEDALFEDHISIGGGYSETTSIFYIDGKMIQYEKYHNCRANIKLNDKIFDQYPFGKYYWFK